MGKTASIVMTVLTLGSFGILGAIGVGKYTRAQYAKEAAVAIGAKEYATAEKLIALLNEDKREAFQHIILEKKKEEKKTARVLPIDVALQEQNTTQAQQAFDSMDKTLFTKEELAQLERRILQGTEQGLYQEILHAESENAQAFCIQYLKKYPVGEKRGYVVERLLLVTIGNYLDILHKETPLTTAHEHLLALNNTLEQYAKERVSLSSTKDRILQETIKYSNTAQNQNTTFAKGTKVKVASGTVFEPAYLLERDKAIKPGSIGTVLQEYPANRSQLYVSFDDVKESAWKRKRAGLETVWHVENCGYNDMARCFDATNLNIALYEKSELTPAEYKPIKTAQILLFKQDAKTLAALLENYK